MISKYLSFFYSKYALIASFGFVLPAFCGAQQIAAYRPAVGVTFSNAAINDQSMSALTYTGWYPGVTAGLDINSQKLKQSIALNFAAGNLKNDQNAAMLSVKSYAANYAALFPINQGSVKLNVGGIFNNNLATRKQSSFINNSSFYEFNSSLGVAAKIYYFFGTTNNGSNFNSLSFGFFSPLVSALSRSNSVFNKESDFQSPNFQTYFKNTRVVTFGRYEKINLHAQFENQTGKLKGLSIGYYWEYYKISEINAVQSAVSTVSVSYYF